MYQIDWAHKKEKVTVQIFLHWQTQELLPRLKVHLPKLKINRCPNVLNSINITAQLLNACISLTGFTDPGEQRQRVRKLKPCFQPLGELQTRPKSNGTKHLAYHYCFFHETQDVGKSEKCMHTQTHKYLHTLNFSMNVFG